MRNYRVIKMERYNRSLKFLNSYMFFLLPAYTIYLAIQFTWRATVMTDQFNSTADYATSWVTLCLAIIALITIWGVDIIAFVVNVTFIAASTTFKIISIINPSLMGKSDPASEALSVMGNINNASTEAMLGKIGSTPDSIMGMTQASSNSLITTIIQKIAGAESDIALFTKAVECEIILLIGIILINYFINHAKFFFTPLEKFKRIDDFEDDL
jgi:hypothetical protein